MEQQITRQALPGALAGRTLPPPQRSNQPRIDSNGLAGHVWCLEDYCTLSDVRAWLA